MSDPTQMERTDAIDIHELSTLEEFAGAVRLQREIWGYEDVELLPLRLFVVAHKIGGQALGAFHDGKMVAFCLCIPGLKPGGKPYLHSHMLGVLPEFRNTGLGRQLKLKQREAAQAAGLDLIEWTFDPLELKNAFFNIERLGTIVRRYVHNQYGVTGSPLHGNLPTDRLIAEWWLNTPRVDAVVNGKAVERPEVEARIAVPSDISQIRQHDSRRAGEIQAAIGDEFDSCFRIGLAVIGFERGKDAGVYLLGKWDSK